MLLKVLTRNPVLTFEPPSTGHPAQFPAPRPCRRRRQRRRRSCPTTRHCHLSRRQRNPPFRRPRPSSLRHAPCPSRRGRRHSHVPTVHRRSRRRGARCHRGFRLRPPPFSSTSSHRLVPPRRRGRHTAGPYPPPRRRSRPRPRRLRPWCRHRHFQRRLAPRGIRRSDRSGRSDSARGGPAAENRRRWGRVGRHNHGHTQR